MKIFTQRFGHLLHTHGTTQETPGAAASWDFHYPVPTPNLGIRLRSTKQESILTSNALKRKKAVPKERRPFPASRGLRPRFVTSTVRWRLSRTASAPLCRRLRRPNVPKTWKSCQRRGRHTRRGCVMLPTGLPRPRDRAAQPVAGRARRMAGTSHLQSPGPPSPGPASAAGKKPTEFLK